MATKKTATKKTGVKKTKKTATKKPKGLAVGDTLPAFDELSWTVTDDVEGLDEELLRRSAGVTEDALRISYQSSRFGEVEFTRLYKKAQKLTVGDVLKHVAAFYQEIVSPEETEVLARGVKSGKVSDTMGYMAEHLLPDPEGPLHMLPPDEYGHVRPNWTDERCAALLSVYSKREPSNAGDLWKDVEALLDSYKKRKEAFPVFPPRKKPPCVRRNLMGDCIFFEGFRVKKRRDENVLDVEILLGS